MNSDELLEYHICYVLYPNIIFNAAEPLSDNSACQCAD